MSLVLSWSENCVMTSKATIKADPDAARLVAGINNPTNTVCKISNGKLYVLVVTFSPENENKLLEN